MAEVLSSGKYSAYLSDDGYMQFGGKYVLGVKPRFREKAHLAYRRLFVTSTSEYIYMNI